MPDVLRAAGRRAVPCPACNPNGSHPRPFQCEPTPEGMRAAREHLGLDLSQMALMLGFEGASARASVHNLETGTRRIRPAQARLVQALLDGWAPHDLGKRPSSYPWRQNNDTT